MLHSTRSVLLGAFALTIIGAAVSAPAEPSTSPVSLLQAKAAEDAKITITEMLKSGKDSSACADLATALLDDVESNIKAKEDILDAMPDGSECTSEGQELVDSAKAALTTAETDAEAARSAAASASSAPVEFGAISLSDVSGLSEGHCGTFETNPAYVAAKSAAAETAAASAAADAAVTAARDAVTSAEEEQKKLIHECKCKAVHNYEAAFAAASVVDDSDTAAWTKAKHMQCVLAGTAPASCEVGAIREIPRRTLAEDPAECRDADYVMYGDVVHIKNMYTVHQSYLDTCHGASCTDGTKYTVSTNDNKNRDHGTGLWQIESTSGATGKVNVGDIVHLKNMYHHGSYLDTCNHGSCTTGTMYQVSTNTNKNRGGHKTGMWQIEMFSGREGYVHYGDELHLKNMYHHGSYLDSCNHATITCAGTRYQVSTNTNKNRGDHKTGTWVFERSAAEKSDSFDGTYTIQQQHNNRFLDAHETTANDFRVVTREAQFGAQADTQKWIIKPAGDGSFTVQQKHNNRFLDAHESTTHDFSVVTREAQFGAQLDSQRWILKPAGDGSFTVQQKLTSRFMDAHTSGMDHDVVMREEQGDDTQRWIITPVDGTVLFK